MLRPLPSRAWPLAEPPIAAAVGLLFILQALTPWDIAPALENRPVQLIVTGTLLITGGAWTALSRLAAKVRIRCKHELIGLGVTAIGWVSTAWLAAGGSMPLVSVFALGCLLLALEGMCTAWKKGVTQATVAAGGAK